MKVTLINGQNHKGSTYNIGRILAEKLTDEASITEFFLPRDLNHFCLGCYQCIEDISKCPFYPEKKIILDSMEQSDVIIFTTPNYCFAPSAQMMAFVDLTFDFWMSHRPLPWMFQKKAVVISTAAGGGQNKAISILKNALVFMGVPFIKTYGIAVQAMNWQMVKEEKKRLIENDMDKIANKISKIKSPKPNLKSKFLFFMFKKMHEASWDSSPCEKQYWIQKGWIK